MPSNRTLVGTLPTPEELKILVPLTPSARRVQKLGTQTAANILSGIDPRKLLIAGPCSADFCDSMTKFARAMVELQQSVRDGVAIIMRCYTGKPRTSLGWGGLQQGLPHEKANLVEGIIRSRKLMIMLLEVGMPLADEMLHPSLTDYFDDLLSYIAVGARSSENTAHRKVASGLDVPVGIKNPTSGDLLVLANAMLTAQSKNTLILGEGVWKTRGNPLAHGILRGSNFEGNVQSNYDRPSILRFLQFAHQVGVTDPRLVIDTNHDNSGKNPKKQVEIVQKMMRMISEHPELAPIITGFMVEAYLEHGRQSEKSATIRHGLSITDPCISLSETVDLAHNLNAQSTMVHKLELLRTQIDEVDTQIINSLSHKHAPRSLQSIGSLTEGECADLRAIGLPISDTTWRLIEKRMQIASEVGQEKKRFGTNHALDIKRRNLMIANRRNQAPHGKKEKIAKFFLILHDASVRIQTDILEKE